jgi:hypothetical protein
MADQLGHQHAAAANAASTGARGCGSAAPERIVDRRHRDDNPWQFREGQYVRPGDFRSRELPGGLRKSAHRGRIISVR